jgi:hypothetical protein
MEEAGMPKKKKKGLIPTHPTLVLVTHLLFFQPHP